MIMDGLAEWDQQRPRLFDAKTCCSFFQCCGKYGIRANVNTFFLKYPR